MFSTLQSKVNRLAAAALVALVLTSAAMAQKPILPASAKSKKAIENLRANIASENNGVKRSAIYLAGKYAMTDVLPDLFSQMEKEHDPSNKILIALSVYNIGQPESISKLKDLSANESNSRVREMINEIYRQYATEHDLTVNSKP